MRLLIKQRVFAWSDTYDVYDEAGNKKYFVRGQVISLGHKLHVYNAQGAEVGQVKQRLITMLPAFEIEANGTSLGLVQKKFTLFRPKYEINYIGWRADGDFMGWNYDAYEACSKVVSVHKELLHWGDTYVIDIDSPGHELYALLLVLAIDAANCTDAN